MPEAVVHFQVRMPPALHEHLATRAREEKTSLNALVVGLLRAAADRREASPRGTSVPAAIRFPMIGQGEGASAGPGELRICSRDARPGGTRRIGGCTS